MKIANFGHCVQGVDVVNVAFFSNQAIWDFDAAFYDLESVFLEWIEKDVWERRDYAVLTNSAANTLIHYLEKRAQEMREFMEHGYPVLFVPSVLPSLKYADGRGNWPAFREFGDFFPACGKNVQAVRGKNVEVRGSPEIVRFAKKMESYWSYGATIKNPLGTPCFFTPKANHVLGTFLNKDKKWMLICPRIDTTSAPADAALLEAFVEFRASTAGKSDLDPLPDWQKTYLLPGETELEGRIQAEEVQLKLLTTKLTELGRERERLLNLKRSFTDKGDGLVEAVTQALRGIGFKVDPGPVGRDDLVASFGDKVIVVEVKGKDTKSGGEGDSAQLEKWVLRYHDAHGVVPKGMLVVNAFRQTPPLKRTGEPFPDQMLDFARGRSHCLITGLQLLCLCFEAKAKGNGAECAAELFAAIGRFSRYGGEGWKKVIEAVKDK